MRLMKAIGIVVLAIWLAGWFFVPILGSIMKTGCGIWSLLSGVTYPTYWLGAQFAYERCLPRSMLDAPPFFDQNMALGGLFLGVLFVVANWSEMRLPWRRKRE